jgi:tetratricopeptide (TPR) repeat protein
MKPTPNPALILLLLLAVSLALAAHLQPRAVTWSQRGQDSVLKVLLGDGRRLFANHFFVKADVYFHSGYYPTIFDQGAAPKDSRHLTQEEPGHNEKEHEKEMDFLGPPKDWVERFGRHFFVTKHTHLGGGQEREILPWLKLSAELDPQRIETYTVAAYWLRQRLGKVAEAEQFLRAGLRANPDSHELLFALGQLYYENEHDAVRARNLWELALRRWQEHEPKKEKPDHFTLEQIAVNLARLEEAEGNLAVVIQYLERAKAVSPMPQALQKEIEEIKGKLSGKPPASSQVQ